MMDNSTYILEALAKIATLKPNKGAIKCPKCQNDLNYFRASNGHVRGTCETYGCLSWVQ